MLILNFVNFLRKYLCVSISIYVKDNVKKKAKRNDVHRHLMHFIVVLRRNSTVMNEDKLICPVSQMKVNGHQRNQDWARAAISKY